MRTINLPKFQLTIFVILLNMFLAGCASKASAPAPVEIPQWVQNPLGDTAESIYGIGEGYSLDSAKKSALRDIAGKLMTKISSESVGRASDTDGQSSRSFQQKVNTQIEDTKLTSYETIRAVNMNGQYYVLIDMKRKVFIQDNKNELDEIEAKIAQELNGINSKNKLLQLVHYNQIITLTESAKKPLYLIQSVDSQFDVESYLRKYRQYEQAERTLSQTTQFKIQPAAGMSGIAQQLSNAMKVNGFQVSNRGGYDAIIKIDGFFEKSEAFSMKMVAINFLLTVKTDKNQLVSSKQYNISGSSVSSHAAGEKNALNQIKNKFNTKLDLYKALGLIAKL